MHPFVDIICLVHNNLPVTKGFVDHLFANTQNFRLLFIDNGSAKETSDWLKEGESKNNRWTVIRSEENLGIILGRNLGATHVTADYFMNIDNDQYVQRGWLDQLFQLMDKGYDVVGVEAWLLSSPTESSPVVIEGKPSTKGYYPIKRCTKFTDKFSYIGCGGMLIKKKVYDDIGLFDERFHPAFFEDPDLNYRCIQKGYKLGWGYGCQVKHLAHQTVNHQKLFNKGTQFLKSWNAFYDKWYPFYPEPLSMASKT